MSTQPCNCNQRVPVTLGDGSRACFSCGGFLPQKENESAAKNDILPFDPDALSRELAMLRRQFNQRVDAIEKLIQRHAD